MRIGFGSDAEPSRGGADFWYERGFGSQRNDRLDHKPDRYDELRHEHLRHGDSWQLDRVGGHGHRQHVRHNRVQRQQCVWNWRKRQQQHGHRINLGDGRVTHQFTELPDSFQWSPGDHGEHWQYRRDESVGWTVTKSVVAKV